jgi:hypothetical protein
VCGDAFHREGRWAALLGNPQAVSLLLLAAGNDFGTQVAKIQVIEPPEADILEMHEDPVNHAITPTLPTR